MVCSHIHAEPLRDRLKGLNELGVKPPLGAVHMSRLKTRGKR